MDLSSEAYYRDDYVDKFNPECYLQTFFSKVQGAPEESDFIITTLKLLHQEFIKKDKHTGGRLLELGSGPCIHSVMSASNVYKDITLTDYSEINIKHLNQWVNKEEGAHDWRPFMSHIIHLEESSSSVNDLEDRVRQSIKEVLPCDLLQPNPLHPNTREPYDCIMTSLCLETCTKDLKSYKQSIKNLSHLLKCNGFCVVVGVLEQTFYKVDGHEFFTLKLSASDIEEAFTEAGFVDIVMECRDFENPQIPQQKTSVDFANFSGFFLMSAKKG